MHDFWPSSGYRLMGRTPDDRLYVMYARANLLYYADMESSSPYAWSTMMQAVPQAEAQLRRVLRSDADRPTWVVVWQPATSFGLDRSGETRRLLARHYRRAAVICGKSVLIRKDDARRLARPAAQQCPRLEVPDGLGPDASRSPADSAEFIWQ